MPRIRLCKWCQAMHRAKYWGLISERNRFSTHLLQVIWFPGCDLSHKAPSHSSTRNMSMFYMVNVAWKLRYMTQQWLLWIKTFAKCASLHCCPGYESPRSGSVFLQCHTGSTFHTLGNHQKETEFISCNWPPSLRKISTSLPPEDVHLADIGHGQG